MDNGITNFGRWITTTVQNLMAEYEANQKNKMEIQKQYQLQQQRLAMLEPAAINLNQLQQIDIANCIQACGQIPTSALPPLVLTPEQSMYVTGHMLQQFVQKRDYAQVYGAFNILIQAGMMNLSPVWHNLYHDLYQTLVAQFVDIPFNKTLVKPYLEIEDTPKCVLYKFKYNIGPYSGALIRQIQKFCVNGIQTESVLAMRQRYGLSNILIGWDDAKKQLLIGVY